MKATIVIIVLIVLGAYTAYRTNKKHIELYKRSILDYYKDYE